MRGGQGGGEEDAIEDRQDRLCRSRMTAEHCLRKYLGHTHVCDVIREHIEKDWYLMAEQPAPALHLNIQKDVLPYALCQNISNVIATSPM